MTNKLDTSVLGAILVAGTILTTSCQPANASHAGGQNSNFREFRVQNANLDRYTARRMFIANRRQDQPVSIPGISLPTVSGVSARNSDSARTVRHFDRDPVRQQSLQTNDLGRLVRLSSGIDLDLTSDSRNIVLGKSLFSDAGTIQIIVGGETKTLTAGTQVTAAEYVAAKQVLSGQAQSVSINRSGEATGGSIDLGALTQDNDVMRASNLVIAGNVTTTGDFGRHSDFRLQGDLINYGIVNALSSDSSVRSGTLHAFDIVNHSGASINSSVDLTLDAAGSLNNDGTIASSQGLTLLAGNSINNSGSIKASGNVNLHSSAINNHSVIQSTAGDINIDGPATADLVVNNSNGTMSAVSGAINLRNTAYNGTFSTTVHGGDLLSRDLNLNSGQGLTSVDVDQLTGTVNETGTAAHVSASTNVLSIGAVCLNGDPTFYNQGDINFTADLTVAENLVVVAAGNITSNNNLTIRAGDTTKGYDISLIAGAAFTPNGGANSPSLPGGTAGGVSLSGKSSKTGGGIQLGSNTFVLAQSTSSTGSNPGGNILLAAFGGKGDIAGDVVSHLTSFSTGGFNGGSNGNITVIGGSKAGGTVVDSGILDTTGGTGGGGTINISAAAPILAVRNQPVVYDATGTLVSGSLIASTKLNKSSNINVGDQSSGKEIMSSGNVSIMSGGTISTQGQLEALNSNILLFSAGNIIGGNSSSVTALSVGLESGGSIGPNSANKFNVDTSNLIVNSDKSSKGTLTSLRLLNATTNVDASLAIGQLIIDSAGQLNLKATSFSSYDLTAQSIGIQLQNKKPIDMFKLTTMDPAVAINKITLSNTKTAIFNVAGDFGATGGNQNAFAKVKSLTITSGGSSVIAVADKSSEISLSSVGDATIATTGGVIKSATSSAGAVVIDSVSDTLKINGNVSAATLAGVENTGLKSSSKIAFGAGSQVTGGTVVVNLGPPISTTPPTPLNVVLQPSAGGTIALTGNGIKAKAPDNIITATGAGHSVTINNGFKSTNLSFGGGVLLTAN